MFASVEKVCSSNRNLGEGGSMRCPVCGKEMVQGYLQSGQRMAWVKAPHKVSLLPQKDEVLLGNNMFRELSFEAYICKTCKKIMIDYSKADYKEK